MEREDTFVSPATCLHLFPNLTKDTYSMRHYQERRIFAVARGFNELTHCRPTEKERNEIEESASAWLHHIM